MGSASLKAPISLVNAFCILVTVYPIFNRYQAPFVHQLTLSELVLIVFCLLAILFTRFSEKRFALPLLFFLAYLLFHVALDCARLTGSELFDSVGTSLRVVFLYVAIAIFSKDFFDRDFATRFLFFVAFAVAAYGLLQAIMSHLGVSLTTYIPFLTIMGDTNMDVEIANKIGYGLRYRCQSILNEPAALCCYLILPLILCLFPNGQERDGGNPRYGLAAFFTLVCFVSASSTGIIVACVVWIVFALHGKQATKAAREKKMAILVVTCVLVAAVFSYSGLFDYFVSRTFGGGVSGSTRFYAIGDMFASSNSLLGILFGAGLQQTEEYLPGFARVYYCLGLIGFLAITMYLIHLFKWADRQGRMVVLFFVVLNVGTEILLGNFAIYYLPFAVPAIENQATQERSHIVENNRKTI